MAPMWLYFVLKMPLGIAILFGIGGRTMFGSFGFRKVRLPKISSWLCWERSGMLQNDLAKCILAHNRLAELQHHDTDIGQSTIGFFNPYLFLTIHHNPSYKMVWHIESTMLSRGQTARG